MVSANFEMSLIGPDSERWLDNVLRIARWDSASNKWVNAFGGGMSAGPTSIVATTDARYYVGGTFADVYGVMGNGGVLYDARDGMWMSVFDGRLAKRGPGRAVDAVVHRALVDQQNERNIFLGGDFDYIGAEVHQGVVAYNDGVLSSVGGGLFASDDTPGRNESLEAGLVLALAQHKDRLFAGGAFSRNAGGASCIRNVAEHVLGTSTWEDVGGGCNAPVADLITLGGYVYAVGSFTECGGVHAAYAARHKLNPDAGEGWEPLGAGLGGPAEVVVEYQGDVYVGGAFSSAGGVAIVGGIARWRHGARRWDSVEPDCTIGCNAARVSTTPTYVRSMVRDTSNRFLYVLSDVGGGNAQLARWNGNFWAQHGVDFPWTAPTYTTGLDVVARPQSDVIIIGGSNQFAPTDGDKFLAIYDQDRKNYFASTGGFDDAIATVVEYDAASPLSSGMLAILDHWRWW